MTDKPLKRPRDPAQLAKLMIDIASGTNTGESRAQVTLLCCGRLSFRRKYAEKPPSAWVELKAKGWRTQLLRFLEHKFRIDWNKVKMQTEKSQLGSGRRSL